MDAAVEKEIVRRYFSKARQDRALYALQSSKRHSYIWKLDESFLPRLMQNGELEYFMRTVPPELARQHAERRVPG